MDKFKERLITIVISSVFTIVVFFITTSITNKRLNETAIVKRVELMERSKAEKKEVAEAKKEAFAYTDKEVSEVKEQMQSGFCSLEKQIEYVVKLQEQQLELLTKK